MGYHRSNRDKTYAVKCVNRKKLTDEDEAALLDEVSILKEMKENEARNSLEHLVNYVIERKK